jgi:uncharacterized protein involved in exopolysaccharide biosynthesis
MEVIAIRDVLRRHVTLIVSLCVVTALAGYGISFLQPLIPEQYEVSALVLVRPNEPVKITASTGKEYMDFPVGQTPVVESASKTYIRIIESPALVSRVVRELELDKPRPKKIYAGDTTFGLIAAWLKALYDEVEPYIKDTVAFAKYGRVLRDDEFTKAIKKVTGNLVLKSYEDTYVVEIQYRDEEADRAAAVANTVARLFINFLKEMRSSEAKELVSRLKRDVEGNRQQLVEARERLREYKESQGVFQTRSEYDAKLRVTETDVEVANTAYEAVFKQLKEAEMKTDALAEARLISPALVPQLPSRPRRLIFLGVAALTGFLVGVALAFFLEYVNRTARRLEDIEDFVGLKVIGTIPLARPTRQALRTELRFGLGRRARARGSPPGRASQSHRETIS